jgi:Spy/CpxP family protein refolding chaperone
MNKVLKLSIMMTLSISALAGCSADIPGIQQAVANLTSGKYSLANTGDVSNNSGNGQADENKSGGRGKPGKGPGGKGGHGMGPGGPGLPPDLNLTDAQKTELEKIREENKPAQPDQTKMEETKTAMEALKKEIDTAFISDTFDAASLKAKLDALKPPAPDDSHFTSEANVIIKTYNILTAEQKQKLEDKAKEMANNVPKAMPSPPADFGSSKTDQRLDKLATDLGLTDAQKASLKEAMQPPADAQKPDIQKMFEKMKVTQDAINTELKTGNASVDKIVAILKANAPEPPKNNNGLERLTKIHDILNADQRKKFIELAPKGPGLGGEGFGHPGHGGPGAGFDGPGDRGFGGPGSRPEGGGFPGM